jgi:hypothetical protein
MALFDLFGQQSADTPTDLETTGAAQSRSGESGVDRWLGYLAKGAQVVQTVRGKSDFDPNTTAPAPAAAAGFGGVQGKQWILYGGAVVLLLVLLLGRRK